MAPAPKINSSPAITANRWLRPRVSHQAQNLLKCLCGAIKTRRSFLGAPSSVSSITKSGAGSISLVGFGFGTVRRPLGVGSLISPCIAIYFNRQCLCFSLLNRAAAGELCHGQEHEVFRIGPV